MTIGVQQVTGSEGGSSAATGSAGNDGSRIMNETGLGREEFLKLLVAQLQYQDPMDPLDARGFVAELAQFANLETLHRVDAGVADLNKNILGLTGDQSRGRALGLIGKMVRLADGTADLVQRVAWDDGGVRLGFEHGGWLNLAGVVEVADFTDSGAGDNAEDADDHIPY